MSVELVDAVHVSDVGGGGVLSSDPTNLGQPFAEKLNELQPPSLSVSVVGEVMTDEDSGKTGGNT